jgi:hypothetical protein
MTTRHTSAISPHAFCARYSLISRPLQSEGAGKAGCRLHPRSCAQKAHEWTTGSTGSFRLSLRNGLGLIRALPGDRAFLPPSPCGLTIHRKPGWAGCISATLDASIGASGPHDFAIRARLAKGLAGPRAIRRVLAKTVSSAVRPRAGRSLTGNPPCDPTARPTLSRPSHPVPR